MNKIRNLKFFGLVCLLTFVLVFIGFHFLQAQVKATRGKPPKPPGEEKPLPFLEPGDIVTTGSNALRVWHWQYSSLDPIWSTETPGYMSVAVGNADNDTKTEVVVPERREVKVGKGKNAVSYFEIFLNIYKEGVPGIWQTTEGNPVEEYERYPIVHEVIIADVHPNPGNEVILLTDHWLTVFGYGDGVDGEFIILGQKEATESGIEADEFRAVTVGNVDSSAGNEILVSAYRDGKGCVYILDLDIDKGLYLKTALYSTIISPENEIIDVPFLSRRSLRVADLDGIDGQEICTIGYYCYRGVEVDCLQWKPYVIVFWYEDDKWNQTQKLLEGWVGVEESGNSFPRAYLDTGDLNYNGGEEIVVSANLPPYCDTYHLILYSFDSDSGISNITPNTQNGYMIIPQARISDVEIGNVNNDQYNEIVVAGNARFRGKTVFYMELFDPALTSLWKRIGERKEGTVIDTAIVK